MAKNDLEERLINFSVLIIEIVNQLPNTPVGRQLGGQLIRSGTSPALNYGEAEGAESRKDFIHKLRIVLKELRETHINSKIIHRSNLILSSSLITKAISESDELIAIFIRSIETAKKNLLKDQG